VEPNPHLLQLRRVSDNMRDRRGFVCLDRNERVDPFSAAQLAQMLSAIGPESISAYPDPSPLIDRLAERLQVPAGWIYPTNGSDAAIRKVFQTYVRPGDRVLLADPTYAMYPIYARMFGGTPETVSYRPDRTMDVQGFVVRLAVRPRIAAIACPDQPTGAVLPLSELRRIAECAKQHDVLCLVDEAYFPFHPVTAIGLVSDLDNVVITRSFSKVGGLAGLRLGYFVARPEIVDAVDRVRGAHEVNAVAIAFGCHLLDHEDLGREFVRTIEAGRAILLRAARELGIGCPSSPANFQLLELPTGIEPSMVVDALKGRGYLVKGGFNHPSVARCLRVTLAGPDIIAPFCEALRDVLVQKHV